MDDFQAMLAREAAQRAALEEEMLMLESEPFDYGQMPAEQIFRVNRDFYESTLPYNWDMPPADRSLDPVKVQNYLAQLQPDD